MDPVYKIDNKIFELGSEEKVHNDEVHLQLCYGEFGGSLPELEWIDGFESPYKKTDFYRYRDKYYMYEQSADSECYPLWKFDLNEELREADYNNDFTMEQFKTFQKSMEGTWIKLELYTNSF